MLDALLRECCLNLHRKCWLNRNTVARLTGAQVVHRVALSVGVFDRPE
jgi:hypothetical protein